MFFPLLSNSVLVFISVSLSWFFSSVLKFFSDLFTNNKRSFFEEFYRTGGMPSGHSAIVSSLASSIYLSEGFSTLFVLSLVFALIVVRDSFGVRYSVGEQALLLKKLASKEHLRAKIHVILGHTFLQVLAGIILGVVVSLIVFFC